MKGINCRAWCLAAMSLIALSVSAEPSALPVLRLSPEELTWTQYPNGVFRAEISGDEKGAGVYVYRVRFPSGFRNQPHFHPDDRIVTVLSGTIFVGFGKKSKKSMKAR